MRQLARASPNAAPREGQPERRAADDVERVVGADVDTTEEHQSGDADPETLVDEPGPFSRATKLAEAYGFEECGRG